MACIVIGPPAFITAVDSFMIRSVDAYVSSTHIDYICYMPISITVPNMSVVAVS